MQPSSLSSCAPARVVKFLRRLAVAVAVVAGLRAEHTGPVPAPVDTYGGPGAFAVVRETFPSPGWPGQEVTVFRPEGAAGPRPTWFFAHGFGGSKTLYYEELLEHLASHGAVVVFSPYPAELTNVASNYSILFDGFTAAAARFPSLIDTSRVIFAGHSYGGGAVPALALRALREKNWGAHGLALLMLAPWYSLITDAELAAFPASTLAIVQIYEDDTINDHRMAIDLFNHLALPAANKDFLLLRSDRIAGYNYTADHTVPTGTNRFGPAFNALDTWGVHRLAQALAAATWESDPAARKIALGHGAAEQTQLGAVGDRALRPMVSIAAPVPLFPSSRYLQRWDSLLNPRRATPPPEAPRQPHLAEISARAFTDSGDRVLIAGTVVAGPRPKSLLVRAVGPSLGGLDSSETLTDPRLAIFRGPTPDLEIDDWSQTPEPDVLAVAAEETGAFPLAENSKDAAVLASFPPGAVTVHARSAGGRGGITLLEIYDADRDDSVTLANLSARAHIGTGDNVLIAGFVTAGPGSLCLLIRAVGPGLAGALPSTLSDPQIDIYRGSVRVAGNDNWSTDPTEAAAIISAAQKVGAVPFADGSADAALLIDLPPGIYTAVVSGRSGATGVGMVEIYAVP